MTGSDRSKNPMNSRLHLDVPAVLIILTLLASACGPPPTPAPVPCDTLPYSFLPNDLAFDHDGNLWITSFDGALRLDTVSGLCTHFTKENGLAEELLAAVAVGPDGDVWLGGYWNGDISRFDGRRWTTYTDYDGSADKGNGIFDITVAPDGALWFGVARYAYRFDGQTWTAYTADDGLPRLGVTAIAAAPDGTIWFGGTETTAGTGGLARFDGESWTSYTRDDGLVDNDIEAIAVAPDGAVWVGTRRGVSRFDGEAWVTYTENDGLANNWVRDIAVGPDGAVWFATPEGISRFDGEHWTIYTESDGLLSDSGRAITVAPDGRICAGVTGGVSCFDGERWSAYKVGRGVPTPSPAPGGTPLSTPTPLSMPAPSPTAMSSSPFNTATWPGEEIRHPWVAPDSRLRLATDAGIRCFDPQTQTWTILCAAGGGLYQGHFLTERGPRRRGQRLGGRLYRDEVSLEAA